MQVPGPIHVQARFPELHGELLRLLESLHPEDWNRPTACKGWAVRDLTAHLLDGMLRRIAAGRDGSAPPPPPQPIAGYRDLVTFLNNLNAEWVAAARRLSPRQLLDLLTYAGIEACEYFAALDPDAPALYPVSWAGDLESPNWFDLAREFTEWWHHQQQIREAVGAATLARPPFLKPVLDTFIHAVPRAYQDVEAPPGTCVTLRLEGPSGGGWTLLRDGVWQLRDGVAEPAAASISISEDAAWRLFTKGLSAEAAAAQSRVSGDRELAAHFFRTLAVMA